MRTTEERVEIRKKMLKCRDEIKTAWKIKYPEMLLINSDEWKFCYVKDECPRGKECKSHYLKLVRNQNKEKKVYSLPQ